MRKEKNNIFGIHAVSALLEQNPQRIHRLLILKDRHDQKIQILLEVAKKHSIKIEFLSRLALDALTHNQNHQGVVAIATENKKYTESDLEIFLDKLDALANPPFLLILDGVQDPHNLGAILRTADAAGVHMVIAPKDNSVGLVPTVCKVASGAAETVPFIQVTNLARTLDYLKKRNIWIMGAAGDADKTLYQGNLKGAIAIVLGAEGKGLRRLTCEHCDQLFKIPMQGTVTSLNVSVAAGIFLFEVVRIRLSVP